MEKCGTKPRRGLALGSRELKLMVRNLAGIDLNTGNSSNVRKFADDTRISKVVQQGCVLHDERHILYDWAKTWQTEFSVGKYIAVSERRNDPSHNYCSTGLDLQGI